MQQDNNPPLLPTVAAAPFNPPRRLGPPSGHISDRRGSLLYFGGIPATRPRKGRGSKKIPAVGLRPRSSLRWAKGIAPKPDTEPLAQLVVGIQRRRVRRGRSRQPTEISWQATGMLPRGRRQGVLTSRQAAGTFFGASCCRGLLTWFGAQE